MTQTQDDRKASGAVVKQGICRKLKAAVAEKKELTGELALLENTECELKDRLDAALHDGSASLQRRLELARSLSALHLAAAAAADAAVIGTTFITNLLSRK